MSKLNICSSSEVDYFVLESAPENTNASEYGVQSYFLFKKNGTFIGIHEGIPPFNGKWDEDSVILFLGDEEVPFPFVSDGDLLKLVTGENPEDVEEVYRRHNEEIPILDLPDGDMTVEVEVTDGDNVGRMSVYCPKGWYYHEQLSGKGVITISPTPDPRISSLMLTVTYSSYENAKFTIDYKEDKSSFDLAGETYSRSDTSNALYEFITIMGDSAITVKASFYSSELYDSIMPSLKLTWNNKPCNLAICQDTEEDFFKARAIRKNYENLTLEQVQQHDYWVCFRKDGTVTIKLDEAATSGLEESFGDTLTGTWEGATILIPKTDQTGFFPYHHLYANLEGDKFLFSVGKCDGTFHRCKK